MIAAAYRVVNRVNWQPVPVTAWDASTGALEVAAPLKTTVLLGDVEWRVDGVVYTQRRVETGPRWVVWLQETQTGDNLT